MNVKEICALVRDRIRDDIDGVEKVPASITRLLSLPDTPATVEEMKTSPYWNGEEQELID